MSIEGAKMNIDLITPGDEPNEKTNYFVCMNCNHKQTHDEICEECEQEELLEVENEC